MGFIHKNKHNHKEINWTSISLSALPIKIELNCQQLFRTEKYSNSILPVIINQLRLLKKIKGGSSQLKTQKHNWGKLRLWLV